MTDAMSLYGIFCLVIIAVIVLIVAFAWIVQGITKLRSAWGGRSRSTAKTSHDHVKTR